MSRYDLIAFDMDGTLLDSNKELLPSSIEAIRAASEAGKTVVFASGRCPAELTVFHDQLPSVRYMVTMNGAMVYDMLEDRVIAHTPIAPDTLREMFDICAKRDVFIQLMSMYSILPGDKRSTIAEYAMDQYLELFTQTGIFPEDQRAWWQETGLPLYKFSPYSRTVRERDELLPLMSALGVETALSETTGFECSAAGTTKGVGLRALCEALDIPADRVIAVGDSDNDISMLQYAGLAVAMGNAKPNVKAVCDTVTSDHDHDGCARVIREYLLVD